MTVIIKTDWPLEERLREIANTNAGHFPDAGINYFDRYVQIKQRVADKYYQVAATGLARTGSRYTKHDIGHVDDVIRAAGHFVGLGQAGTQPHEKLEPFEVFSLLYAILLHDAGNAFERKGHETRPFSIMQSLGDLCPLDSTTKLLIASIAQAHGGRAPDGSKDTIPAVIKTEPSHLENITVHARRLAAIVRMADELSENPRRADEVALMDPDGESYLPNFYCKTIKSTIHAAPGTIYLQYTLFVDNITRKHKDPENNFKQTYVIDYIRNRILKCDQERRYCNRFLHGFALMPVLKASIDIYNESTSEKQILVDLSDTGYPAADRTVLGKLEELNGNQIKRLLTKRALT